MLKIIPAIDLLNGKVVRLERGDYSRVKVYGDPLDFAQKWKECGFKRVHVVDLDGARTGQVVHWNILKEVKNLGLEVQFGGGIRDISTLDRVMRIADYAVIGTSAWKGDFLKRATEIFGRRIIVALDVENGQVKISGWTKRAGGIDDFFKIISKTGVEYVLYTDICRDGTMSGVNLEEVKKIVSRFKMKLIIAGGISSIDDIKKLNRLNVWGVIIGKALYEGIIKPEQLVPMIGV